VVHDVRYRPGDSAQNLILRSALWDAWNYRCCWCSHPRDLLDVDIDHLIPQSYSGSQLQATLDQNLTDELRALPFDIHAPHNLGPGCRRCNVEKANRDFLTAPRFMALLAKARQLEPTVIHTVGKFRSGNAFTKALATVTGVDPTDTEVMGTLAELGPALINRLRYIAPDILEGPSNYDYFDPDGDATDEYVVTVTLDETSRRRLTASSIRAFTGATSGSYPRIASSCAIARPSCWQISSITARTTLTSAASKSQPYASSSRTRARRPRRTTIRAARGARCTCTRVSAMTAAQHRRIQVELGRMTAIEGGDLHLVIKAHDRDLLVDQPRPVYHARLRNLPVTQNPFCHSAGERVGHVDVATELRVGRLEPALLWIARRSWLHVERV
jgi:hypothetical protein